MKITAANIHFNEQGTPASKDFDDVYFSNHDGMKETEYVFLQGNRLLERWKSHQNSSFCIAETGFGTGLNFFCTSMLFQNFLQDNPNHILKRLFFISTEKHPIEKAQAVDVLKLWPQFNDLSKVWINDYPVAVSGIHRRHISPAITLDLHYNDAADAFNQIMVPNDGLVDAWFLDGFAPSKNNSMWSQALFNAMARITRHCATLATFTAAGFVKRGLAEAGFKMSKQKGFGKKREMLVGEYTQCNDARRTDTQAPYFHRYDAHNGKGQNKNDAPRQVTIVGNGLAGAITALKLVNEGISVNLIWQGSKPADGASGSPIGGFYPQLNAQDNMASKTQLASFLYATSFYRQLAISHPFDHQWCGALQLGFNENTQDRLQKLINKQLWPKEVAHSVGSAKASIIANLDIPFDCLFMPNAGWVSPSSLVNACLKSASNTNKLNLIANTLLQSYACNDDGTVTLVTKQNDQIFEKVTEKLILTTGMGTQSLIDQVVPLRLTRGQVELVESKNTLAKLTTLLCHKGYLTPPLNGFHALGSTYIKNDVNTDVRPSETQDNFNSHINCLSQTNWANELPMMQTQTNNYARAAVRCSSPDHLPVVGAVPSESQQHELSDLYKALPYKHYQVPSVQKNVFVLSALGSRGLTTAPLMAEVLVSQILERPIPLSSDMLDALNPNRFLVRALIRRQAFP